MTDRDTPTRPFALITGASSGIGSAFAERYARAGFDLLLVAREPTALEAVAYELRRHFGSNVISVTEDLSDPRASERIKDRVEKLGIQLDVLVNNAGSAASGPFSTSDRAAVMQMMDVNVRALTELTHALLPGMIARRCGRIINVGSLASFVPVPALSVYAATKAYVLSFTEGLSEELRNTGVTVTAVCPGITNTPMLERLGTSREWPNAFKLSPTEVAREAIEAAENGEVVRVPGMANQATVAWARYQPRWLVRSVNGFLSRLAMDF